MRGKRRTIGVGIVPLPLVTKYFGVGVFDPGTGVKEQPPTARQLEMQGIISPSLEIVPKPGSPEFWGALVLAGVGGYAAHVTRPARVVLSWVAHPLANLLSAHGRTAPIRYGAKFYLQASKAYRYSNYVAFAYSPFATFHYLKAGEHEKAMIHYFGPPGSVHIYEKFFEQTESMDTVAPGKPIRRLPRKGAPKEKPVKMPQAQRMRLWRMGLRWCKKHNRYDRCSLRARK